MKSSVELKLSQKKLLLTSLIVLITALLGTYFNSSYQKCIMKTTNLNSSKEIKVFFREWCGQQ